MCTHQEESFDTFVGDAIILDTPTSASRGEQLAQLKVLEETYLLSHTILDRWRGSIDARDAYLEYYTAVTRVRDIISEKKKVFRDDFCKICQGKNRRNCQDCKQKAREIKDLWVSTMSPYEQMLWTLKIPDASIEGNEALEKCRRYYKREQEKMGNRLSKLLGKVIKEVLPGETGKQINIIDGIDLVMGWI